MTESETKMIPCTGCDGTGEQRNFYGSYICDICRGQGKVFSMTITKDNNILDFSKFKKEIESNPPKKPYAPPSVSSQPPATEFKPLLKFEDQSPSFTHGFELGSLFQILFHMKPKEWIGPCHTVNASMLKEIAKISHYSIEIKETEYEEWIEVTFVRLNNSPKPRVC